MAEAKDKETYTPIEADIDKNITCRVTLVDESGELFEGSSQSVKISNLASSACPDTATEVFASGVGTEADPYVICNDSQLI